MARSFHHTTVRSNTSARSERSYKTTEHRRERRATHITLLVDGRDELLADPRAYGNPYFGERDGKRFDPAMSLRK